MEVIDPAPVDGMKSFAFLIHIILDIPILSQPITALILPKPFAINS